ASAVAGVASTGNRAKGRRQRVGRGVGSGKPGRQFREDGLGSDEGLQPPARCLRRTIALVLSFDIAFEAATGPVRPGGIVKAWKAAGAKVGWMTFRPSPGTFLSFRAERDDQTTPDAVPAFSFENQKMGAIEKLPAPEAPFGLVVSARKLTDGELKRLAA